MHDASCSVRARARTPAALRRDASTSAASPTACRSASTAWRSDRELMSQRSDEFRVWHGSRCNSSVGKGGLMVRLRSADQSPPLAASGISMRSTTRHTRTTRLWAIDQLAGCGGVGRGCSSHSQRRSTLPVRRTIRRRSHSPRLAPPRPVSPTEARRISPLRPLSVSAQRPSPPRPSG